VLVVSLGAVLVLVVVPVLEVSVGVVVGVGSLDGDVTLVCPPLEAGVHALVVWSPAPLGPGLRTVDTVWVSVVPSRLRRAFCLSGAEAALATGLASATRTVAGLTDTLALWWLRWWMAGAVSRAATGRTGAGGST
jgi:hypothetical protein